MSVSTKLCRHLLKPKCFSYSTSRQMSDSMTYNCKALNVTKAAPYVFSVELNRPSKMNAINKGMWEEVGEVFNKLDRDQECRVVILSAAGKMFSSGIDLSDLSQLASIVYSEDDIARKSMMMYQNIRHLQDLFTTIEKCKKPVIGCVHSACVGAGVDLITTTDIRMCTTDAWFCVKEVDMGLAADVGTLQRLPKVIGSQSLVSDLCLTARRMESQEAERCGLVSSVFQTKEEMMHAAMDMATMIAAKSPVAVQGTKMNLVYSREHSVEEGLDEVAKWNMTMLQSEDLMKSAMAAMDKTNTEPPEFADF
eukprot:TRINITY_DN3422_c0_g1_i1.p1 TRINITY_DN3422_c0_g1~~TRINITY_DN3422_c0_g1_i1.p1  ORF type:complete len:308 (+),score=134.45 TRINITY_DN3422_c0_g1_i1:60-983(+)